LWKSLLGGKSAILWNLEALKQILGRLLDILISPKKMAEISMVSLGQKQDPYKWSLYNPIIMGI